MAEPHENSAAQAPRMREVAGYEIISKLGQGGMGAVFKARQKSLDRIVALKILPPNIARDAVFIERFQREARASAKLNHANIVQGIDVGKDPATGLWYFAMEYVDGPSLHHVLKEQKLIPEKRALEITRDIARALECAGHHGIVHRDVKPDNILLTQRGEAKLADLGLAKQLSDDASVTQSGQSVGTPNYMAPEQARGDTHEIDIRTDIYALGGTLFHFVTGRTPYTGDTSVVIMTKHLTEPPPKARTLNPEVSEACSKLITRMMQKKREQRVQNPATLIQQIDEILNAADAPKAEPAARRARQDTTGPRAPVARAEKAPGSPWVLGLAGLVVVGILAFILLKPKLPADTVVTPKTPDTPATRSAVVLNKSSDPKPAPPPVASAPPPIAIEQPSPAPAAVQPSTPHPAPQKPPVDWAAVKEFAARVALNTTEASEKSGKLSGAELRNSYERIAKQFAGTKAGTDAEERLKTLPQSAAADAKKVVAPNPADIAAKEAEERAAKVQALFSGVLKETAPLLALNKFNDVHTLLDQKINSAAFADARDLLKQEKADVQAIQELRHQAVETLNKMAGKSVSLKKGSGVLSGKIEKEAKADSVTLKVADGPEFTLNSEQLHIQDVDTYADNATPEDLRRRGLLYLAAGDKDSLVKAKMFFIRSRDGGLAVAGQYLDRIAALELGEVEVAAEKAWAKAEAFFAEKRLKEADEAYAAFQAKYAKTKVMARNADVFAARMKAIEKANKPEITFRADDSMKMFPPGQHFGDFPAQEGQDPLAPFDNKAAYFMQKTGTDVVYDVRSPHALKSLRWKGAAMQNMTIEILDAKGTVLTTGGPYQGGNKWAEFSIAFEPRKEFTLRLRNHISMWYFVGELELK